MADIINLRLARKQQTRRQNEQKVAENRALHGRTKAERQRDERDAQSLRDRVDSHKRERDSQT
jgi:hypothetical protein